MNERDSSGGVVLKGIRMYARNGSCFYFKLFSEIWKERVHLKDVKPEFSNENYSLLNKPTSTQHTGIHFIVQQKATGSQQHH